MIKIRDYTVDRKKVVCFILELFLYISLYIATICVYIKHYSVTIPTQEKDIDILIIIWNELVNVATIAPVFGAFLINLIILKIKPQTPATLRILWSIIEVVLILFYRVAIAINMHRVIIALVGLGSFIACIILSTRFSVFYSPKIHYNGSHNLKNIIGNIKNRNILSIQFLGLNVMVDGAFTVFSLNSIDHLFNSGNDVNCILSTTFRLKSSDYEYFKFALETYEKVVETGQDIYKEKFLQSISKTIQDLKERLKNIDAQNVTKDNCCLARLLICYLNLEKLLDNPGYAVLELDDGQLGIDVELEKELFTAFRSGLLGAILFGNEHRYVFRYKRDGYKTGRKYCAFPIEIENLEKNASQKEIICLIALRENDKYDIPYSVMQYVVRCEEKIANYLSRNNENGSD